jgi:hypothetical protein
MSPLESHLNNQPFWYGKLLCQEWKPAQGVLIVQAVPCSRKYTPEVLSNQFELLENQTSHSLQLKIRQLHSVQFTNLHNSHIFMQNQNYYFFVHTQSTYISLTNVGFIATFFYFTNIALSHT